MRRGERFRPLLCNAYAQRELQRRTLLQFAPNLDSSRAVNRDFLRVVPGSRPGTGDADATGIGTRLTGTIESIDGDVITLSTPAGPQRISTISGTRITITQAGDIDDLTVGDRVTIAAVPGPEPDVAEAVSITVVSVEERKAGAARVGAVE